MGLAEESLVGRYGTCEVTVHEHIVFTDCIPRFHLKSQVVRAIGVTGLGDVTISEHTSCRVGFIYIMGWFPIVECRVCDAQFVLTAKHRLIELYIGLSEDVRFFLRKCLATEGRTITIPSTCISLTSRLRIFVALETVLNVLISHCDEV